MKSVAYSVCSGFFASLASLGGKFAMGSEDALWLCETAVAFVTQSAGNVINQYPSCRSVIWPIRVVFFAAMLLFNALMWTTFVKALRYSKTSLEATVTNTAANFFFTAIFGQVLFGEFMTLMWWIGTVLIVFGLLLMHQGNQRAAMLAKRKKRH